MKRIAVILLLLICFVFVGCKKEVPISEEQALKIASEYWGIENGDIDLRTNYRYIIVPAESENENHLIVLKWLVENNHYSTVEAIEIDVETGEVTVK